MEHVRQPYPVVVKSVKREAEGICSITLERQDRGQLPAFGAGAHIEVHLGDQSIRHYSICSDPMDRLAYKVAVLLEAESRGGSRHMHALTPGHVLMISGPKNRFPLAGKEAAFHLLLAGGIGITPMLAMIAELERRGARYRLHYCAKFKETAAFREELAKLEAEGRVIFHFDGGDPEKGLNIAALLAKYEPGTHLYFCGPPGFMKAAKSAISAWPPHAVHYEHFAAPLDTGAIERKAFRLQLESTGQIFDVPAGKSIVEVLEEHGVAVPTDCREGFCGSCITNYVSGEPEHHDTVLSEKERRTYVMLCCARAKEGSLLTIGL